MNPQLQGGSVETKGTPVSVVFQTGVKLAGLACNSQIITNKYLN